MSAETVETAIFASNVRHVGHQIESLNRLGYSVHFVGNRTFSHTVIAKLKSHGVSVRLAQVLGQRPHQDLAPHTFASLGLGQYLPPLLGRSGLPAIDSVQRTYTCLQRNVVRRQLGISEVSLGHFTEGLFAGIRKRCIGSDLPIVCEFRAPHHCDFETPIETSGDFPGRGPKRHPLSGIFDEEIETASRLIVYSGVARDSYLRAGISPKVVDIVPIPFKSPTDGPKWSPTRSPRFLFVGRLDEYKGFDVAAESVRRLGGGARLMAVGGASQQVKKWLASQRHIEYLGILSRKEIATIALSCTAYLMPSYESFGLSVLEMAAIGLPVYLKNSVGVWPKFAQVSPKQVVHDRTSDSWASILSRHLSMSDEELSHVSQEMLGVAGEFSFEESVDAQLRSYRKLLEPEL